jgi:hypothetical protein
MGPVVHGQRRRRKTPLPELTDFCNFCCWSAIFSLAFILLQGGRRDVLFNAVVEYYSVSNKFEDTIASITHINCLKGRLHVR